MEVSISVEGSKVTIIVNDRAVADYLQPDELEVFWIGYSLPGDQGSLFGELMDLEIEKR